MSQEKILVTGATGHVGSHFVPLAAPGMIALGLRWMLNPESPFVTLCGCVQVTLILQCIPHVEIGFSIVRLGLESLFVAVYRYVWITLIL